MKTLQVNARPLIGCALAAMFLAPTFAWSHGAVDIPIARQVKCKVVGGYWSAEDGSGIADAGCRAAALTFNTPAERAYQMDQWNEVAKLIAAPGYNDQDQVQAAVPDGSLCSAGDPKKAGLDVASQSWYKTSVVPKNGKIAMRLIGTAPHVPSFVKVYITKPGYTNAESLKWSDLTLIHEEEFNVARTDWSSPSTIPGASGFFQFDVPVPNGQTGNAVLYTHWQRIDPAGEGFYNCSDINIEGQTNPFPWFDKGTFVPADITPKDGDTVRFRVLGHAPSANEVVDIKVPITASNVAPAVWGKQLADQLASSANIIKVGVRSGDSIAFDAGKIHDNLIYLANEKDSTAMSISSGGNPDPGQPAKAVIAGSTSVKAGEKFTLTSTGSTGKAPLTYQWFNNFTTSGGKGEIVTTPSVTYTAPTVDKGYPYVVNLAVVDANKKGNGTQVTLNVDFGSGGGDSYPAYKAGTDYKAGDKVSNKGANFECKPWPFTAWCKEAGYEPGVATHWDQAWIKAN